MSYAFISSACSIMHSFNCAISSSKSISSLSSYTFEHYCDNLISMFELKNNWSVVTSTFESLKIDKTYEFLV